MATQVQHPGSARPAWIALVLIPVGFVVSMVVGEGLYSAFGYDSSDESAPAGVVAASGGTAILVFAIPCVAAWLLGRRAVAAGDPAGKAPALVGAMVGIVFVLLNLVAVVARML